MSDQGGTRRQFDIYHHIPIFTIIYHHFHHFTPYRWLNTKVWPSAESKAVPRLLVSYGTAEIDTESWREWRGNFHPQILVKTGWWVWEHFFFVYIYIYVCIYICICIYIYMYIYIYYYILGIIIPTDELIFFRGVGIAPTRKMFAHMLYPGCIPLTWFLCCSLGIPMGSACTPVPYTPNHWWSAYHCVPSVPPYKVAIQRDISQWGLRIWWQVPNTHTYIYMLYMLQFESVEKKCAIS